MKERGLSRGIAPVLAPLAILLALGSVTSTAQAFLSHELGSSFAAGGNTGVAVDETTGDVYVLSAAAQRIKKFDSNGQPKNFSALDENVLDAKIGGADWNHQGAGGWCCARDLAVDNSDTRTDGNIYVATGEGADAFSRSGKFLGTISVDSDPGPEADGGCGVTVDKSGSVYVSRPQMDGTYAYPRAFVDKFTPGFRDEPADWIPRSTLHTRETETCELSADSTGAIYTKLGDQLAFQPQQLQKYKATLFNQFPEDVIPKIIDETAISFTTDQVTDDAYVTKFNQENVTAHILRYDSDGTLVERFGSDFLYSSAIAANGNTGRVYIADFFGGGQIYDPVITPDIADVSAIAEQSDATVSATVTPAGTSTITECKVEYGTTDSYGESVPCEPDAPFAQATSISASISDLAVETTYYYRIVVANENGLHRGLDQTFTTHAVQGVQTKEVTGVTRSSAILNGSFDGNGEATQYYFEWGSTPSYGNTTAPPPGVDAGAPSEVSELSAVLEELDIYTKYHYRLVASNPAGITYGVDRSFYTAPPNQPEITGVGISAVSPTTATIDAEINPGMGDTFFTVQYGPDPSYGQEMPLSASIGADDKAHPVSAQLEGLSPGQVYHFRIVATNFGGTSHSPDQGFFTPAGPRVDEAFVTTIGQSSAQLGVRVAPNGSRTSVHFEYGTTTAYGAQTASMQLSGEGTSQEAWSFLTGLRPNTTYHFRAVAANAVDVASSEDQTFLTSPEGTVAPPKARRCPKRRVRLKGKCIKKKRSEKRTKKNRKGGRTK